ncbi:MAG: hypothetical protein K2H76_02845, partial [Muribaculaceae bacterium]|nr:hypothetical protein [Muribaculaceae bacterium]
YGCLNVDIEGTKAYVSGFSGTPTGEVISLEGTFDAAAGTISIPTQDCGMYDDGDNQGTLKFIYEEWISNEEHAPVDKPLVLTYDNGKLMFPEVAVVDIAVYIGTEELGFMTLTQANDALKYPNKLDNTGWESYCKASFTDPWVSMLFETTEEDRTWTVDVQKRTENGSTYLRLVDPYGEGAPEFIQQYNESPCQGSIVLDVTDEKCVMAVASPAIPSGFALAQIGLGMFYNYSEGGFEWYDVIQQGEEPYTYDELREGLGTKNLGEIKDNVIYVYKCSFGGGIRAQFGLNTHWTAENGSSVDMTAKIALNLAGVNDVVADDANAPVKYFNLQGMEVANPEAGQIVIKKQGSKTVKVVAE